MQALITGVGGFAGQYLAAHLVAAGETVVGLTRREVAWHVAGPHVAMRVLRVELTDPAAVQEAVAEAAPDRIYHLAALTSVGASFQLSPLVVLHNNIDGLVNLLEAVRARAPAARVLVVSSSEVYGRAQEGPLDEHAELRPESPYAVSKVAQDLLGYQYWRSHGVYVVRVRPFNHLGPGQSDRFVTASFARQLAEIERGRRAPVLRVGNLEAQRDFTDVRDVVRAYHLAIEVGEAGAVYNVGSGVATSIRAILEHLCARSTVQPAVETDPALLRPTDAPVQVCDNREIRRRGWEPRIPLAASLDALLDDWRARVR